jgi:hypothetical protein
VDANTASTAAIVRGARSPSWLGELGLAARLVADDGRVVIVGGWPADPTGQPAEAGPGRQPAEAGPGRQPAREAR